MNIDGIQEQEAISLNESQKSVENLAMSKPDVDLEEQKSVEKDTLEKEPL